MDEPRRDLHEKTRLWQLVFAVWVSFVNNALYSVGSYTSPILRDAPYNFTQSQLALVNSITGIFVSFSLPTGWIFDRYGSAVTLRVGAGLAFLGFSMYALMFHNVIPMSIATLIISGLPCYQYVMYFETGSFVTNLATFARDKGTVILVEETFGSAILASWYVGFLNKDTHLLLVLLPIVGPLVVLIASFFIERPTVAEEKIPWHGHKRFLVAYGIVGFSLFFYTATDIMSNFVTFSGNVEFTFAVIGVMIVVSYVLVPITLNDKGYKEPNRNISFVDLNILPEDDADEKENEEKESAGGTTLHNGRLGESGAIQIHQAESRALLDSHNEKGNRCESSNEPPAGSTKALWRAVKTPEIWLLMVASIATWGASGMIGGNQPQIYQALNDGHLDKTTNALYVSVGSVARSLGRAAVAILDSKTRNKASMLVTGVPCLGIGCFLIAVLPLKGLVFAMSLAWFGDAMVSAARALVLKQLFNGPHFGLIYNLVTSAYIPVPFIFNLGIFATLYDKKSIELTGSVHNICPDRSCIAPQMFIGAGVSVIGTLAAMLLWRRNRQRLQRKDSQ